MRKLVLVIAAASVLAACSHGPTGSAIPASGPASQPVAVRRNGPTFVASDKIKHIVFIIQENRTFDSIFGGSDDPKNAVAPYPGADAAVHGQTIDGRTIPLTKIVLESSSVFSSQGDTNNYHPNWLLACNAGYYSGPPLRPFPVGFPSPCRMNGFDQNAKVIAGVPTPAPGVNVGTIYSYVDHNETKPYWDIAKAYALGDRFFMGHNSESYTGHQYLFSGQSHNVIDTPVYPNSPNGPDCASKVGGCAYVPWGCDSPDKTTTYAINNMTGIESATPTGPAPCFGQNGGYNSIADLINHVDKNDPKRNLTWTVYAWNICSGIIALDANWTIRHNSWVSDMPDWQKCFKSYGATAPAYPGLYTKHFQTPNTVFFLNEKPQANPKWPLSSVTWILPGPFNSDHPGIPHGFCGPTWVAELLNSIGENKADWDSTVVFVVWDDWGGFYDHVPPYVVRDQQGPGFRVPLLVVSPYVRAHTVVHTNIEFATLLKFTEDTFGLGSLGGGATDTSPYLGNLNDFFDFNAAPRPYTHITPTETSNVWCTYSHPLNRKANASGARWLQLVGDD